MSKKIVSIFFILLFLANMAAWSQDERLYLSTCYDAYFPGQEIHLKIWKLFDEQSKQDETFVFTELLSASNETVSRKIVNCNQEGAAIKFRVPDAIPSGFYLLRAYTSEMRNHGVNHFAYRKIMILNPAIDNKFPFPGERLLSGKTIRAEFFPLGGKILQGIVNRVYVQFDNLPQGALEGALVLSSYDDTLATLVALDQSTAYFDFVPYAGKYEIRMPSIFPHRKINIPPAEASAYSLRFTEGLDQIRFLVSKNDTALDFQGLKIKIENINSEAISLIAISHEMYMDMDELLPGLNRFSLISEFGTVLSENYYLKEEEGGLSIKYLNPENDYSTKEKVTFQLQVSSSGRSIKGGVLNVFVRKAGRELLSQPAFNDYYSYRNYLYLEPEWDPGSKDHLDAIEAIYGPELFKMKAEDTIQQYSMKLDQNLLCGRFHDGNTSNLNIYLSFPGDSSQIFVGKTDNEGHFSFPVRSVHGKKELFIKSEDSLKNGFISIDERFVTDPSDIHNYPESFDSLQQQYLDRLYQEWLFNQVYHQEQIIKGKPEYRLPMFYDQADFYLSMDNYVELPNMEEVFFEIVKPVMILRENRQPYLKVIDRETNRTIGERPLYVIDGAPFTDPQIAFGLSPVNVRDISIVARKYFIGQESFDGIIIINTRSNNLSDLEPDMVYLRQNYIFPESSNFILHKSEPTSIHKPYNPPTIYWNSNLVTGSDGRVSFSFVTPDIPGQYEIWIEALDKKTGIPGMNSITFTVKD